jgi:hypothetical protein
VPFDATITQSNAMLRTSPFLLSRSPYGEGWIFTMEADNADAIITSLMKHKQAAEVYRRQAEILERQFTALYETMNPEVGITMADGGLPIDGLAQVIGERVYFEVIGRLFRLPG